MPERPAIREALEQLRAAVDALDTHYAQPQAGDDLQRLWLIVLDAFTFLLKTRSPW